MRPRRSGSTSPAAGPTSLPSRPAKAASWSRRRFSCSPMPRCAGRGRLPPGLRGHGDRARSGGCGRAGLGAAAAAASKAGLRMLPVGACYPHDPVRCSPGLGARQLRGARRRHWSRLCRRLAGNGATSVEVAELACQLEASRGRHPGWPAGPVRRHRMEDSSVWSSGTRRPKVAPAGARSRRSPRSWSGGWCCATPVPPASPAPRSSG